MKSPFKTNLLKDKTFVIGILLLVLCYVIDWASHSFITDSSPKSIQIAVLVVSVLFYLSCIGFFAFSLVKTARLSEGKNPISKFLFVGVVLSLLVGALVGLSLFWHNQ